MGRAIGRRGAIVVWLGGAHIAANVMRYVGPFYGGSMGAKESSFPGCVAAGTASMLAVHESSAEASRCTLIDTAVVVTISADSVAGRYRDTTDLHEVNL
jgi:hypothetical protein